MGCLLFQLASLLLLQLCLLPVSVTAAAEEAEELPQEAPKKEREQAKGAEIDIERLMREMTKRLWEEREASGRRLRR